LTTIEYTTAVIPPQSFTDGSSSLYMRRISLIETIGVRSLVIETEHETTPALILTILSLLLTEIYGAQT